MSRKVFELFQAKPHFLFAILQPGRFVALGAVDQWIFLFTYMPRERILLVKSDAQHFFRKVLLVSVSVKISALTFTNTEVLKMPGI